MTNKHWRAADLADDRDHIAVVLAINPHFRRHIGRHL